MSSSATNILDVVQRGIDEINSIDLIEDGVRVTTHCMYPSNSLVRVTVRGGDKILVASDEGGAVAEAQSAGVPFVDSDRTIQAMVRDQGLLVSRGIIRSPNMPIEASSLAIILVANASRDVANFLFDRAKLKPSRDFKELVAAFLKKRFDDSVHPAEIVGTSNKVHKFANVISLPNGRRLIVDPVTNDASSINSRIVANLDVKAAGDPNIIQRIIYDDTDTWAPANLNLLNVGATVVPFSRTSEVLERVALTG